MLPCLAPLFPPAWREHATGVALAPPGPAAPSLARWLDAPDGLAATLARHAAHIGAPDNAAAASVWSLTYFWRLLPPMVAAASLLQRALPAALTDLRLELDAHALPARFLLADEGQPLPHSATAQRYGTLLHRHIEPLAQRLRALTGLAPRIVWGNAARYLDVIFAELTRLQPGHDGLRDDRAHLLDGAAWPGGDNPMHRPVRVVTRATPEGPRDVALLRRCCLYYQLPGHDYCDLCPLAPGNRGARRCSAETPADA